MSPHRLKSKTTQLALLITGIVVVISTTCLVFASRLPENFFPESNSAINFGKVAKPWPLKDQLRPAAIWIDNTIRYQLDGLESEDEFAKLLPAGGSTIRFPGGSKVGDRNDVYTVALFHQLECLGVIRRDYARNRSTGLVSQHCLNYLRQSILCLADARLESVRAATPPNIVSLSGDYVCKDWSVVYKAAQKLQRAV